LDIEQRQKDITWRKIIRAIKTLPISPCHFTFHYSYCWLIGLNLFRANYIMSIILLWIKFVTAIHECSLNGGVFFDYIILITIIRIKIVGCQVKWAIKPIFCLLNNLKYWALNTLFPIANNLNFILCILKHAIDNPLRVFCLHQLSSIA